jgi:hypothetical protein
MDTDTMNDDKKISIAKTDISLSNIFDFSNIPTEVLFGTIYFNYGSGELTTTYPMTLFIADHTLGSQFQCDG